MNGSLYPPGLLSEFSIPHYAIRNPLNWTAEIFNVSEAISDQSQGHPDVDVANLPASSTSSTGSTSASTGSPTVTVPAQTGGVPVGVIAGGTVVGVVAVCLVAALVTWFLCRRRTHTLEEERDSLLRRRSKRPEENIDPYIYESPMPSRSPSLLPRDKYSSGCATVATTRSTSASTLQVPSANDRPVSHVPSRLNHSESSTSTVAAAPNHGQIPVEAELEAPMPTVNSALPVTQTSPPPYRHTPEMTPVSVRYLSSPEAAASHRGDNPHPSHWQNMDPAFSTWNSLSGRESDIVFATMTSSNLPVSPFSSIRPAVRFGTRVEGGVDDHEGSGGIISRIA
ncbi:hypothetical protein K435DRAFT_315721 [Dendrothele bispora CBS 962.96]|uniref:Uncharacterized protein n=1 Tax=Dendrothele bispora (strain CBS 962.96) TaxID=1314807 RepID=A0A4S8LIF7_DENBC|nr:hypothetical protein K435DRAFT_315721 [Dendrothele bispora CBS 962.96]